MTGINARNQDADETDDEKNDKRWFGFEDDYHYADDQPTKSEDQLLAIF